jgi:putative hydrolase of the HAD superfamily
MRGKYKHVFFDLDHTLWDFETNSRDTLGELFSELIAHKTEYALSDFIEAYETINFQMWADYSAGKLDKESLRNDRFPYALNEIGIVEPALAVTINEQYMERTPYKKALFPKTREVLSHLGENHQLHLITNGFAEVVEVKMTESDLWSYFQEVVISEVVGFLKPHPGIFEKALDMAGALVGESVFIGDNLVSDIGGAQNFGMDQVYFNPKQENHDSNPTYEVSALSELIGLF